MFIPCAEREALLADTQLWSTLIDIQPGNIKSDTESKIHKLHLQNPNPPDSKPHSCSPSSILPTSYTPHHIVLSLIPLLFDTYPFNKHEIMSQQIPCCLLKFGSASEQPKRPMSLRIRPNPSTNAGLLSAWRDGRMASVLQVTWALVLRCYTDSGDICFGYQHVDAGEEPAARGVSPNVTNLTTVRLAIGDGDSTHELVKKAEGSAVLDSSASHGGMNATAEGYLMFNTIVMIRTHEGRSHGAKTASLASPLASTLPEEVRNFRQCL